MPRVVQIEIPVERLRERLGLTEQQLPDDATPEQVALLMQGTPAPSSAAEFATPDGMVLVDGEVWRQVQESLHQSDGQVAAALDRMTQVEQDGVLDAAVTAGKIPPGRKEHYRRLLASDPVGTRKLLAELPADTIPVRARASGSDDGDGEFASGQAYPEHWLGHPGSDDRRTVIASD